MGALVNGLLNILVALSILGGGVVLLALPFGLWPRARTAVAMVLLSVSWMWGATLWLSSASILYYLWGLVNLIFGLLLGIVGVVPLALIALMVNGRWPEVAGGIMWLVAIYGLRTLAAFIAAKAPPRQPSKPEYPATE